MVDKNARKKYVALLKSFLLNEVTNFFYEENTPNTKDDAILAIDNSVWCFYDDFREHKLDGKFTLSGEEEKRISRWVLFLKTKEEYLWPKISYAGMRPIKYGLIARILQKEKKQNKFMAFGDYSVWPFVNKQSYEDALSSRWGQSRLI